MFFFKVSVVVNDDVPEKIFNDTFKLSQTCRFVAKVHRTKISLYSLTLDLAQFLRFFRQCSCTEHQTRWAQFIFCCSCYEFLLNIYENAKTYQIPAKKSQDPMNEQKKSMWTYLHFISSIVLKISDKNLRLLQITSNVCYSRVHSTEK